MEIEQVIKEVAGLQEKLIDVDGLSGEYPLWIETNSDYWAVNILGHTLISSEDYDEVITLEYQILEEMKEIRNYLNLVLKAK